MNPSLETLAELYRAADKQELRTAQARILKAARDHGYTHEQVFAEVCRLRPDK